MLVLDPETTALILVDLQHGILALPLTPYDSAHVLTCSRARSSLVARSRGLVAPSSWSMSTTPMATLIARTSRQTHR